jgi:hypothetical protein
MSEFEEISLDDIPTIEVGQGLDIDEFVGSKKVIERIGVVEIESPYTEDGVYNEKLRRKVKALKVETEVVTTIKTKEGKTVPVRASELFNMKQTEDGKWGISNSPRAKIQKFLKRQKILSLKELVGTKVQLKDYEDKKTGNKYLGFVCE